MAYLSRGKRAAVKETFASSSQPKKSRSRGFTPCEGAEFGILSGLHKDCFEAGHTSKYKVIKNKWVFAVKKMCKGDFLMQYTGDLISKSEADEQEI